MGPSQPGGQPASLRHQASSPETPWLQFWLRLPRFAPAHARPPGTSDLGCEAPRTRAVAGLQIVGKRAEPG